MRVKNTEHPEIIVVTEVIPKGQKNAIMPGDLSIAGYQGPLVNFELSVSNQRNGKRGIAIYVSEGLVYAEENAFDMPRIESVVVSLTGLHHNILIAGIYRSPSSQEPEATKELCAFLELISGRHNSEIVVVGDFNYPEIDWANSTSRAGPQHQSSIFLMGVQENLFFQHVTEGTRYRDGQVSNTLDLIMTNSENSITNLDMEAPLGLSDHVVITFSMSCGKIREKITYTPNQKDFNRGDYNKTKSILAEVDWELIQEGSVEDAWRYVKTKLDEVCESTVPIKRSNKKKSLFINRDALKAKKKKDKSFQRYRRTRSEADLVKYKRYRNDLRSLTRKLRCNFEKKLASGLKENPTSFWKYYRSHTKQVSTITKIQKGDGTTVQQPKEKATVLNDFFSSVFIKEDQTNIPNVRDECSNVMENIVISQEMVKERLQNLKGHKTQGPDGIHPRILKEAAEELCYPLAMLFTRSLNDGELPKDWKTANVTPIHKKGRKDSAENYRPISLTSQVCKVLESIIREKMIMHFMNSNILSEAQHGFVPGRSCVSQLLQVIEEWTESLDDGNPIDVLYLDFKKAFDSVAHNRLIVTLHSLGIRGKLLDWIRDFLRNRKQRVILEGAASNWSPTTSGVPQGSVLGPTLFIAAVYSLPHVIKSSVMIYADDTKVYRPISSLQDTEQLQQDLNSILSWSEKWQLPFNKSKCKIMHIGSRNPLAEYSMANHKLERTTQEKDLGIMVDDSLLFHAHADMIVARAYQTLAVINRTFLNLDEVILPLIYKALVRPILEYANTVWGPIFIGDMWKVEKVQKRATRMIPAIRYLPYEDRLKRLKLPTLRYRRDRGDMITVYNMFNGSIRMDWTNFYTPAPDDAVTRGHSKKLRKPVANTAHRQRFFSHRIIDLWNGLPEDVISSKTTNDFKQRLDKHWKHRMYN